MKTLSNVLWKIVKKQVEVCRNVVNSPIFEEFIKECRYFIVTSKADEQYWIVDDDILIKQLQGQTENKYSEIITSYYTQENYINVKKLLYKWKKITCIADRMTIFEDCYNAMQTISDKRIINNTVIPTLTAQITGLTEDLHKLVPTSEYDTIKKELTRGGKTPSEGEITLEYLWRQEPLKEISDCYTVIFEAVMKNTRKIENFTKEDLEKYNKYRNKILHGDKQFLNYGTDENLVRSWLELNTLIKVYSIYRDFKTKELENE